LFKAQLAPLRPTLVGSRVAVHGPQVALKTRLPRRPSGSRSMSSPPMPANTGHSRRISVRVDISWGIVGGHLHHEPGPSARGRLLSAPGATRVSALQFNGKATTERSVDGKVDLDYAPSGVTWRLTCPTNEARWSPGNVRQIFRGRGKIELTARDWQKSKVRTTA